MYRYFVDSLRTQSVGAILDADEKQDEVSSSVDIIAAGTTTLPPYLMTHHTGATTAVTINSNINSSHVANSRSSSSQQMESAHQSTDSFVVIPIDSLPDDDDSLSAGVRSTVPELFFSSEDVSLMNSRYLDLVNSSATNTTEHSSITPHDSISTTMSHFLTTQQSDAFFRDHESSPMEVDDFSDLCGDNDSVCNSGGSHVSDDVSSSESSSGDGDDGGEVGPAGENDNDTTDITPSIPDEILHAISECNVSISSLADIIAKARGNIRVDHQSITTLCLLKDTIARVKQDLAGRIPNCELEEETKSVCIQLFLRLGQSKYETLRVNFPLLSSSSCRVLCAPFYSHHHTVSYSAISQFAELTHRFISEAMAVSTNPSPQTSVCPSEDPYRFEDVMLAFDETHIVPKLTYSHNNETCHGLVSERTLVDTYVISSANTPQAALQSQLAKSRMSFETVPLQLGRLRRFVSGGYNINTLTATHVLNALMEQVMCLVIAGLIPKVLCSDGASSNIKVQRDLTTTTQTNRQSPSEKPVKVCFAHWFYVEQRIFWIYDFCHFVKIMRNNFGYSTIDGTKTFMLRDPLTGELVHVDWSMFVAIYTTMRQRTGYHAVEKGLSMEVFNATSSHYLKMRTGVAAAFFSNKNADPLQHEVQCASSIAPKTALTANMKI
jgi:hypothetical protein